MVFKIKNGFRFLRNTTERMNDINPIRVRKNITAEKDIVGCYK